MVRVPGGALDSLRSRLRGFTRDRDWHQFHSPKNLAMALAVEVAEILEHFQWLTEEQSRAVDPEKLAEIKDEIGDVLIYLVRLADELGIDPLEAANQKLEKNEKKYPADKVKGKALKYDEYPDE
jgi:NTP pyrophosphatase (non-canonical NTP hydrolase)